MEVGDYFDVLVVEPGLYRVAIGDAPAREPRRHSIWRRPKGSSCLSRQDLDPTEFIAVANQALSECMEVSSL